MTPVITVQINDLTMTNARQNQSGAVRIQARATVTMDRCTVSNSDSWADDGGGIYRLRRTAALTLTNSTISGNHALIMGGGIRSDGTLNIVNSTITDNDTGAVFGNLAQGLMCAGPARCTLRNSIVAGNGRGAARRHRRHDHQPRLQHHRQDHQQPRRGLMAVITATTGDQFDTGAAAVDLQPLANNGGPTPTHALGAASIAIDKGESSGSPPISGASCVRATRPALPTGGDGADIGAFEVQGACLPNRRPTPSTMRRRSKSTAAPHHRRAGQRHRSRFGHAEITAVTQGAHGAVVNNGASVATRRARLHRHGHVHLHHRRRPRRTDTATVTITVEDTTPPQVTVSVASASLWPPNHQLENVGLSVTASDNGGAVTTQVAVFSDEDDLAPGSGNLSPDAKNIAPATLRLRAERSGSGDGRVYLIVVTATDASSNVSAACATVVVPHSNSAQAQAAVAAQAAAARPYCEANAGAAPAGYVVVGDGPVVGPKQ